jgi:hypothetical protein
MNYELGVLCVEFISDGAAKLSKGQNSYPQQDVLCAVV